MTPRVVANRYTIDRLLGRGGMGEVYLAHQLGVGNRVAVKFLTVPADASEKYASRFLAEARLGVSLTHPGIAQVLDAGTEPDGQLYIVFEYVDGEDLRRTLSRNGALPFAEAKEIISRVGEALAFAHARGVVHRDLKPENIRVRSDLVATHVKVLDFGIARLTGDARLTAEGSFSGTPAYMSPEQALGEDVDGRADVYCLGLVLFELLTGQPVVATNVPATALLSQLQTPMPRLGDVVPSRAAPAIDLVLARACAKHRDDRYPDMAAFVRAVQALDDPHWSAMVARPAPRATLATPLPREPRAGARWLLPLLAVAALGVAGLALGAFNGKRAPTPALTPEPVVAAVAAMHPTPVTTPPAPPNDPPAVDAGPIAEVPRVAAVERPHPGKPPRPPPALASANPPATTTVVVEDCPQLRQYSPALTSLSREELMRQLRALKTVLPSAIERQFATQQAMAESYAVDQRECLAKATMVSVLLSMRAMAKIEPGSWVHDFTPAQLREAFRAGPLQHEWSPAQREDVLQQVEIDKINHTTAPPEDIEYYRRLYLGELVGCELTKPALERLHGIRPEHCSVFRPTSAPQ